MDRFKIDEIEQKLKLLKLKSGSLYLLNRRLKTLNEEFDVLDREINKLIDDITRNCKTENCNYSIVLKNSKHSTGLFITDVEKFIKQMRK